MMSGVVLPCIEQLKTVVCSVVIGCTDLGSVMSTPVDDLADCLCALQYALAGYCEFCSVIIKQFKLED